MKKYLLIFLSVFSLFFVSDNVFASVEFGLSSGNRPYTIPYNTSILMTGPGDRYLSFGNDTLYNLPNYPRYFLLTMCTDATVSSYSSFNNTIENLSFFKTDYKCYFPGSSYDGGRVMYIFGQSNSTTQCSVNGDNCLTGGLIKLYNDKNSSWTLLQESYSRDSISIDYASNTIVSNDATIINQNNSIINGQYSINNSINNQGQNIIDNQNKNQQQTNNKLDDVNKNLSDDTAPDTNSAFSDIKLNTNSAISNLVLMPINYLNRVLSLSQNTCSAYSIDFGIFNSNYKLNLPCIKLENYFGSTWWNVIDYLICFFMIYNIIMLAISAFEDITSLRDSYDSLYQPKHADTGYKPKHGGD